MKKETYIKPIVIAYPIFDKVMQAGLSGSFSLGDFNDNGDPAERNDDAGW